MPFALFSYLAPPNRTLSPAQPAPRHSQSHSANRLRQPHDAFLSSSKVKTAAHSHDEPTGTLAILDDFETKTFSLYNQGSKARDAFVAHGAITAAHAKLNQPHLKIQAVQSVLLHNLLRHIGTNANQSLQKLEKTVETAPQKPDAMNISCGEVVTLERIRKDLNLPALTPDNVDDHREFIVQHLPHIHTWADKLQQTALLQGQKLDLSFLDNLKDSPEHTERIQKALRPILGAEANHLSAPAIKAVALDHAFKVRDNLQILERTARHAPIFVSAGNDGPDTLNLFLLAKGTHGVGALDAEGKPAVYSGKTDLIRDWATTNQKFLPVLGNYGNLAGFSLVPVETTKRTLKLGQATIHLPANQVGFLSNIEEAPWDDDRFQEFPIQGTSFATPQVAAKAAARRRSRASKLD